MSINEKCSRSSANVARVDPFTCACLRSANFVSASTISRFEEGDGLCCCIKVPARFSVIAIDCSISYSRSRFVLCSCKPCVDKLPDPALRLAPLWASQQPALHRAEFLPNVHCGVQSNPLLNARFEDFVISGVQWQSANQLAACCGNRDSGGRKSLWRWYWLWVRHRHRHRHRLWG